MKCRWEVIVEVSYFKLSKSFDLIEDAGAFAEECAQLTPADRDDEIKVSIVPVFEEGDF